MKSVLPLRVCRSATRQGSCLNTMLSTNRIGANVACSLNTSHLVLAHFETVRKELTDAGSVRWGC